MGRTSIERQANYRALFPAQLDAPHVEEIRMHVNRGWPLGSDRFKNEVERALETAVRPRKRGRPPIAREMRLTTTCGRKSTLPQYFGVFVFHEGRVRAPPSINVSLLQSALHLTV